MKKFVKYLLVLCLIVPFAFMFAGCGEAKPANVMTMSVNPEVSFVLDANNNVISVKYNNADSSMIYADVNFVGKDVNTTVQLFIERAAISGHIELTGDEVSVKINGEVNANLDALKEQVETKVKDVFKQMGVTVTVKMENLSKEAQRVALETTVKALAPEYTETEIKAMSNDELLKVINDKQKEYKDLAFEQVNQIQATLEKTVMSAVNSAKELLNKAEAQLKELEDSVKDLTGTAKDIVDTQIKTTKQQIAVLRDELDKAVKTFNEKKDELIAQAKAKYAEIKNQLITTFKEQVAEAKTAVIAHLRVELDAGRITQEQFDYWNNLINDYAVAA